MLSVSGRGRCGHQPAAARSPNHCRTSWKGPGGCCGRLRSGSAVRACVRAGWRRQATRQPGSRCHTRLSGVISAWSRSYTLRVKPGRSACVRAAGLEDSARAAQMAAVRAAADAGAARHQRHPTARPRATHLQSVSPHRAARTARRCSRTPGRQLRLRSSTGLRGAGRRRAGAGAASVCECGVEAPYTRPPAPARAHPRRRPRPVVGKFQLPPTASAAPARAPFAAQVLAMSTS